jgi:hypothetical protein
MEDVGPTFSGPSPAANFAGVGKGHQMNHWVPFFRDSKKGASVPKDGESVTERGKEEQNGELLGDE